MTPSLGSSRCTLAAADRGTSTTLDVTLCLLLVSAAVGVLAAADPPVDDHDPRTAGDVADRLTTATVAVDYALPDGDGPESSTDGSGSHGADGPDSPADGTVPVEARERTVQGTPASLLARAAVADVAVDGAGEGAGPGPFERAVANHTERVVAAVVGVDASANVTATYAPLPGSDVRGRASVGSRPPGDVDVSVVRVRVPVAAGDAAASARRSAPRAAERDGFAGVARALADATVSVVLPTTRSRWGLRDAATAGVVTARYRTLGRALGVAVDGALADDNGALADGDVERANERLASVLADRFERVLRERYDGPLNAANATAGALGANATAGGAGASANAASGVDAVDPSAPRPRTVTVTVRTWSA